MYSNTVKFNALKSTIIYFCPLGNDVLSKLIEQQDKLVAQQREMISLLSKIAEHQISTATPIAAPPYMCSSSFYYTINSYKPSGANSCGAYYTSIVSYATTSKTV